MRNLFQQVDITVSDYQSEHASGYRYEVPFDGKIFNAVMITKCGDTSVPYIYLNMAANGKERESVVALVIEYECQKGNKWAQKMKDTALALWDRIKTKDGEISYPLAKREICIKPCIYGKEIKDATPSDIEYYLVYDNVVNGGDTIFDVCRGIVNYDKDLELYENDIIELQKFFDEHCREAWGKPYEARTEEEREDLGTFSDWHKDIYGYRPRNNENNRCINKEQRDEEYER